MSTTEGDALKDFDTLDPEARVITFGGVDYDLTPLEFGRLPAFAREAVPVIRYLTAAHGPLLAHIAHDGDKAPVPMAELMLALMDVMGAHGEHVISAVAVATRIPEDTLRGSTAYDELLAAVFAVVQVNIDFFGKAVGPTLKLAVLRLAARAVGIDLQSLGAGSIPSTS